MAVRIGDIETFPGVEPGKEQAVKVLEEASEVFGAWQQWHLERHGAELEHLLHECADLLQATANMLAGLGVVDMTGYVEECRKRNEIRGRFSGRGMR